MCLLAVYSAFSWLPTMLASEGLSPAIAGSGLTAYNLGVFGALIRAVVITRYGSRWPLAICCTGAAASAFLLQGVNIAQDTSLFLAGIGLHGLFVNAVQCSLYALCAYVYPTLVRATGTVRAWRSAGWERSSVRLQALRLSRLAVRTPTSRCSARP